MLRRTLVCSSLAGAAVVLSALPASAGQEPRTIDCGGQTYDIRINTPNNNSNGGWGVAQIVSGGSGGSGHFIALSFTYKVFDVTTQTTLFSDTRQKANGNANRNQTTTSCTVPLTTGTLSDLLQPGDPLPPGTSLSDTVTTGLDVVVVVKAK